MNSKPHIHSFSEVELRKILAEIDNLLAETRKMQTETRWHPIWVGAAIFAAGATLAKLFLP